MNHDDIKELLGPVALDAASDNERAVVNHHVDECAECRAELDGHRATAAMLGATPALPPDAVWERISSKLGDAPPPIRLVRARNRSRTRSVVIGAAAAAVLVIVAVGMTTGLQTARSDSPSQFQVAQNARNEPGAQMTVLTDGSGNAVAEAVMLPDGRGYLFNNEMRELPPESTYQLWAMIDQQPISAGVLGSDPTMVSFYVAGGVDALAVTEEQHGGVPESANAPIAMGSMSA